MNNFVLSTRVYNPQIVLPIRNYNAEGYFNRSISILIYLGLMFCGIIFILILMIGGVQWITAGGNKQALESARSKIVNAIIGLVIVLLLWMLIRFINAIFGINLGGLGLP